MRILAVCTANVCRSPMAAALLERHCARRGLDVQVTSAGTHAGSGQVEATMLEAMAERDIDLSMHRPRQLDPLIIATDGADLVVAMTREHLRAVAITTPGTFSRTFTAKELARRVGPDRFAGTESPQPTISTWLHAAGAQRSIRQLLGDDIGDDIEDPYRASLARHIETADEIDELAITIARSLAMWLG